MISRYPKSPESIASLVSIGYIELEKLNKPSKALGLFEKYLKSNRTGPLLGEASYGKLSALRALGRFSEEKTALEEFIEKYPNAIQTRSAKKRLDELNLKR